MKSHRKMIVCCGAGLLALGASLGMLRLHRSQPVQPRVATPEQTAEYLASEEFAKMDSDAKQQFVRELRVRQSRTPVMTLLFQPGMSNERRRRVLENVLPVIGPVIDQRIDEFDRLPPAEQTARLDGIIDQLQQVRREHPEGTSSPELLSLMLQYVDPHTRAKVRKHIPALRARMKERGITSALPF
jgi:hypothetical protein